MLLISLVAVAALTAGGVLSTNAGRTISTRSYESETRVLQDLRGSARQPDVYAELALEHFVREMGGVQSFVTFKKEVTNNRYNNVGVKVNAVILESGRPTAVKAARRLKDRLYKVGIIPTVDIKFVTVEE